MHRSAPRRRLSRILACAAVPVMLVAAGCSDGDGGKEKSKSKEAEVAASASAEAAEAAAKKKAEVAPAKFAKLPAACKAITAKTVDELVPKAKDKNGTAGASSDATTRSRCSWDGLSDKGVSGSQWRWLALSLNRLESDPTLGAGEKRAQEEYAKAVAKAKVVDGAKDLLTSPAHGVGDEATAVTHSSTKSTEGVKGETRSTTIVARTGNVVLTLDYNGTGYAGAKFPRGTELMEDAVKAAKEAVAAVAAANK
ncbi:DUF3558 domain-containing protein [Streptomyces sp. NPDC050504]|uniref:DUF3558 domain-containing protein n=1 Tax=Streptomyces sp. NPDC050504 TaxID=3365618 RepID=UPI0037B88CC4